ncbi:Pr6Pr family membrane protein [Microbacterium sp. 1.5R]|uniref:Pr6Pr family membrane protein n=1 Tax=Microbacterium sp. 1.5R TaxID=1916917 RepID=UPI0011A48063|nr:Pr6Pr family membrane protein [Microbacterium sp. 1.5R]
MTSTRRSACTVAALRLSVGAGAVAILSWTYVIGIPRSGASPFDYFGYFTNLTTLITSTLLIAVGLIVLRGRSAPVWLSTARGVAVACMVVVGLVYNLLVPGTGSAPAWVSTILHTILPVLLVLDWTMVDDRPTLPWQRLWLVLPYPLLWLAVVLVRGVTDGWVPYGFLLPERGVPSLVAHVAGLVVALLCAGAAVWLLSRVRSSGRRSARGGRGTARVHPADHP